MTEVGTQTIMKQNSESARTSRELLRSPSQLAVKTLGSLLTRQGPPSCKISDRTVEYKSLSFIEHLLWTSLSLNYLLQCLLPQGIIFSILLLRKLTHRGLVNLPKAAELVSGQLGSSPSRQFGYSARTFENHLKLLIILYMQELYKIYKNILRNE
jgi:hypothetical protein